MHKSMILLAVILSCSFCSGAQDNTYDYKDTTTLYPDSVETKAMAEEPGGDDAAENYVDYIPDTVLVSNHLFLEPDSVNALKNSKSFTYAKNLDSLLNEYQKRLAKAELTDANKVSWLDRLLLSPVTKYFFWILAGIFVSFVLYKLFFTEGFFQRPFAATNVTGLPAENENLSRHTDYGKLIAQAITNGNYRMAVRYHYLQSLQKLSAKGAIQFAADKTNFQYLGELSGKPYKKAFASLTLNYEYVWYGAFEIDQRIFNELQNKFKQFNSEVN